MLVLIPGTHTTQAGVYPRRQFTQETASDSSKQRKCIFVSNILHFRRMPMIDKTKATNAKMLKQKAKRDGNAYVTPEYLGNKIGVDTREKKEEEADLREKLKKQVRNEKPAATEEGVNATVTRLMYEKNLKDAIPDDQELTLKPDMTKTL